MNKNFTIKAGSVLVDGVPIGRVEKVEHDGLWASSGGIRAGGFEWTATAPDGTVFDGFRTRKAAAERLVQYAEPLAVTNIGTGHWVGETFTRATVTWQGYAAMVSQYPNEDYWVVDAYFRPGSFCPAWSNGEGTRFTKAHVLNAEMAATVDAAVAEARATA